MRIARQLLDEIVAHAREEAPNECCGMVAGARRRRRPRVYRARNAEASPLRYEIHPQDQFRITTRSRSAARRSAAIYHSHTTSPAEPSQTDINLAENWPDLLYLICSLADAGGPVVRGFAIRERRGRGGRARCRVGAMSADELAPLACPRCARKYSLDERFCADCGMPLVYVGRGEQEPITEAHERARKVKPQYTGGELVSVACARNLAEAELIQGILLEEGIPSVQRRSRGFDVPDFLAAGPRDILVPEAGAEAARELLADAELPLGAERPRPDRPATARRCGCSRASWSASRRVLLIAWLL